MTAKDVELFVNDQKLSAKLFKPDGTPKKLALLFLHGWTGQPNEIAAAFMAEQGYYCLTIRMRGHPGSEGDIKAITAADSMADAVTAYAYLRSQVPQGTGIAAVGNSYGGFIAAVLSDRLELAALSLRVPANYPDEHFHLSKWGRGHDDPLVDAWRYAPHAPADNHALGAIHDFTGPIQIIEGGQDKVIPHQTVQNYVDAASPAQLEYVIMKDWPHSIGDNAQIQQEFHELLIKWVNSVESAL
jgi:esterase/lipase